MPYKYIIFCVIVLASYAYANAYGYVYGTLFSTESAAQKAANHYHK
jgi:hypothetical protein